MRVLGYDETVAALDFPPLVEALRQAFRKTDFETPSADLHSLSVPDEPTGSLIVLPAWLYDATEKAGHDLTGYVKE